MTERDAAHAVEHHGRAAPSIIIAVEVRPVATARDVARRRLAWGHAGERVGPDVLEHERALVGARPVLRRDRGDLAVGLRDDLLERGHVGEPILGLLRERREDDGLDLVGDVGIGADVAGSRSRLVHVLGQHAHEVGAGERGPPGQQLEHHAADGVDVGAAVDWIAAGLLRGHVAGGPEHGARAGQAGVLIVDLGDAEVEDLDVVVRAAAIDQEHVPGLHVPVDDPGLVRGPERADDLKQDVAGPQPRQPADLLEQIGDIAALEQLHHEEHRAAGHLAEVHDVHDVLVADHRRGAGLL